MITEIGPVQIVVLRFVGAVASIVLVFGIAGLGGRITSVRIVAVGYVLQAVTSFMIFASDSPEGARAVLF